MNDGEIRLRALERTDLRFIHQLNNNRIIMAYWFEEPMNRSMSLKSSTTSISTTRQSGALSQKMLSSRP